MRLITEVLKKKLELQGEAELKHNYLVSVWNFYACYNLALALLGREDKEIKKKNYLVQKFIDSSKKKMNFKIYSQIKEYMKKDIQVINETFSLLESTMEENPIFGDYDLPDMIGISVYDN